MKKFLAGTILAALTIGANASAQSGTHSVKFEGWLSQYLNALQAAQIAPAATFSQNSEIAVARLDGGRLIPTPHSETVDWGFLDNRVSAKITQLGAANYLKYIPEIAFQGQDTMNKIDEIRLTAANEGYGHVLIYGVGPDASWASFGKRALSQTGLTIHEDCKSWDDAKAKALLVDSFSGEVIGAVTANDIDHNIGQLADRVGEMIKDLSA